MTREEAAALVYGNPEAAIDLIVELVATVAALQARIEELERKIALLTRDSSTSSKPPSSDGPVGRPKPRPPKKSRKPNRGGQPGHKYQPCRPHRSDSPTADARGARSITSWNNIQGCFASAIRADAGHRGETGHQRGLRRARGDSSFRNMPESGGNRYICSGRRAGPNFQVSCLSRAPALGPPRPHTSTAANLTVDSGKALCLTGRVR
jgi:hypothetical protein